MPPTQSGSSPQRGGCRAEKGPMCGPLRPPPVRAEHEVETSGLRGLIAVSNIDKRRKPHRKTPAGQVEPEPSRPFDTYFLRPPSEIATLCSITWGARDRQARHSCQHCQLGGEVLRWSGFFFSPFHFFSLPIQKARCPMERGGSTPVSLALNLQ